MGQGDEEDTDSEYGDPEEEHQPPQPGDLVQGACGVVVVMSVVLRSSIAHVEYAVGGPIPAARSDV